MKLDKFKILIAILAVSLLGNLYLVSIKDVKNSPMVAETSPRNIYLGVLSDRLFEKVKSTSAYKEDLNGSGRLFDNLNFNIKSSDGWIIGTYAYSYTDTVGDIIGVGPDFRFIAKLGNGEASIEYVVLKEDKNWDEAYSQLPENLKSKN